MWQTQTYFWPFVTGALLSLVSVPVVIAWYQAHGWDAPHRGHRQDVKDTHATPVPRGGGVSILLGILLPAMYFTAFWEPRLAAILLGALVLVLVGTWDDVADISPFWRLGVNFAVAFLVLAAGVRIEFVTNPFGGGVWHFAAWPWLPWVLTSLYLVALTNITNWAKGVDGQLPGVVVIAAFFIGLLAIKLGVGGWPAILSFIVAGSFAGFLVWNFYPQKIMPGYGGGSLAGFMLGVLSILAGTKIVTLFMVLALPIADAAFTVLRRLHAHKSIFLGDRGHLHHKLLDRLHWGRRRIALFYWATTLLLGVLALVLPLWGKVAVFIAVVVAVFYFLIYIKLHQTA